MSIYDHNLCYRELYNIVQNKCLPINIKSLNPIMKINKYLIFINLNKYFFYISQTAVILSLKKIR